MNRVTLLIVAIVSLTFAPIPTNAADKHVVLPNPTLLGCRAYSCSQLWQEKSSETKAVYPKQVTIDVDEKGLMALYDQSVDLKSIKEAVDERYGRWAFANNEDAAMPVKLWRVEPDKFSIQLSEDGAVGKSLYWTSLAISSSKVARRRASRRSSALCRSASSN